VGLVRVSAADTARGLSRAASRGRRWVAGSAALFVAATVLLPLAGPAPLDFDRVWARADPDWTILWHLRVTRTLLGLFGGAALALAGALFQSMLRDALATPYTLGVSTGASLGAVVAIALGWHVLAGVPGIWAGALAGAAAVLLLVVVAATRQRHMSAFGLLLAGIATNSVCSALILLIHGLSSMADSFTISRWLIGSLDAVEYPPLVVYIAAVLLLSAVVIRQARSWNLLAVGEAWAATRGARVSRLMFTGYASGSLLAAATVALTGPIGFIGLVVPHVVRTRVSADDRVLMPCAFFLGGVLLASCDAIGRVVLAPAEIPAGAITAFIGGPYLVWLVRHRL
jgi:iron complex transport system permease protein